MATKATNPLPIPDDGRLVRDLATILVVGAAYFFCAALSLRMALVGDQVSPIWPPTGVALVALLLFGYRVWPGITLAAFGVNAPISESLLAAAAIAAGNTLAPLVASFMLRRIGFRLELDRLRDAAGIVVLGALGAMTISATVGTTALARSEAIPPSEYIPTWLVWWAGDAMGVLIVAPFLLSLLSAGFRPRASWARGAEASGLLVAIAVLTYLVFQTPLHIQYLVFPLIGLAAWRFRHLAAATAALLASAIAIWAAVKGTGPFLDAGLVEQMITLQVFNASVAFASTALSSLSAERQRNLTERKRIAEELAHRALHDPLTGLANRTLFMDRLGHSLARSRRRHLSVAVMFLDLDNFKVINDSLGHDAGDRILTCMADRLQTVLRPGDTASRFGGDEFLILCEDIAGERDAVVIADRIARVLSEPIPLQTGDVVVTTSVGIALSAGPQGSPEALLRDADAAVYRAKERGRARYELFDHDLRVRVVKRLQIENELRRAIEAGELRLHFQPIVSLEDRLIQSVEALVRWQHPERGFLGPAEFVPTAEETGLIIQLDTWVLRQACLQSARWRLGTPGGRGVAIAVNLSARQLARADLEEVVRKSLAESGVQPKALCVEITENVLMEAGPFLQNTLRGLRALGVRVAIDDFGVGYSSLSYLRRFQVDALKIDRSFIGGLGTHRDDSAIVAATIGLAHALDLSVTAEGVETREQVEHLRRLGCDAAQGFYFARPAPLEGLSKLIARPSTLAVS
jgi:diguanylate cyclase (GGDEF)-like protein